MPLSVSRARHRSALIRRRTARAAAWGLFFLLASLPFIYRICAR